MKKIRASYSLLSAWSQGRYEDALMAYFHIDRPMQDRYIDGDKLDKMATEYIDKHQQLPPEWGGDALDAPLTQFRIEAPYNSICNLTGYLDIYEPRGVITELKSGKSSARDYSRTKQVPFYIYGLKKMGKDVTFARIIRYNQNDGTRDRAIVYPNDNMLADVENWIDTIVPEIYQYFTDNDLWHPEEVIKKRIDKSTSLHYNRES